MRAGGEERIAGKEWKGGRMRGSLRARQEERQRDQEGTGEKSVGHFTRLGSSLLSVEWV